MNVDQFKAAAERIAASANTHLSHSQPGRDFIAADVRASLFLLHAGATWLVSLSGFAELCVCAASSLKLDGGELAEHLADRLDALDVYDPSRGNAELAEYMLSIQRLGYFHVD